jgi:nitrous oxidase accessory protein NosD
MSSADPIFFRSGKFEPFRFSRAIHTDFACQGFAFICRRAPSTKLNRRQQMKLIPMEDFMAGVLKTGIRVLACSTCLFALALNPAIADDDEDDQSHVVKCDKGHSLQKRLDKARDGATVRVRGVCEESIRINKNRLTLECLPGGGIVGDGTVSAVVVSSQNVTVTGCDIQAGGTTTGIVVVQNGAAVVSENTIAASGGTGVTATQGGYAQTIGNTISASTGVRITGASVMDVVRNIVDASRTGIFLGNASTADIVGNTLTGPGSNTNSTGLFVTQTASANVSNDFVFGDAPNTFQAFGGGILCRDNSAIRIGSFNNQVVQDDGTGNGNDAFYDFDCATDIFGGGNGF